MSNESESISWDCGDCGDKGAVNIAVPEGP